MGEPRRLFSLASSQAVDVLLELVDLGVTLRPGITGEQGLAYACRASYCAECNIVALPKWFAVDGEPLRPTVQGIQIDNQMRRSFADISESAQFGATALAILFCEAAYGLTVLARSPKGTGFDYFLVGLGACPQGDNFLAAAVAGGSPSV